MRQKIYLCEKFELCSQGVCSQGVCPPVLINEYGLNVFVYIDVFDDNGNKYGHALDVIGAYKDENGETIYTCVNPNTGRVEDHNKSDFTNPTATFAVIKTHK